MKTLGYQLLASPAFANDQNWSIKRCSAARQLDRIEKWQ